MSLKTTKCLGVMSHLHVFIRLFFTTQYVFCAWCCELDKHDYISISKDIGCHYIFSAFCYTCVSNTFSTTGNIVNICSLKPKWWNDLILKNMVSDSIYNSCVVPFYSHVFNRQIAVCSCHGDKWHKLIWRNRGLWDQIVLLKPGESSDTVGRETSRQNHHKAW